ncbi:MAG: tRNA (guanine(46)-N(7))-methyltransferase TrmB [Planctomycetota bacterium]|nr:tRNA (guanine(46)-N(7))-methyltransferase TrmB [Planctomycetota bacterium]
MTARPLSTSIRDHVVPWRRMEWPIDWAGVFGRRAPLAVEIGFGNGEFLAHEAGEHPERDHVGIELSWTSGRHLIRRLDQAGGRNVRMVLCDATAALHVLFTPQSVDEVFVNHPCPWPKERHFARRLVQPGFIALLADRMKAGARLTIVTDHADYAVAIADVLEAQEALVPIHGRAFLSGLPKRRPTKYERRGMAQGARILYFPWRKASEPAHVPATPSFDPLDSVPSVTLQGACDAPRLFDGFETLVRQEAVDGVQVVVKLVGMWRRADDRGGEVWLVDALVREDDLQQEFALQVVEQPDRKFLIKLSNLGHPHPTFGVKRAVWHLATWLRTTHPGLEIVSSNLGERASGPLEHA